MMKYAISTLVLLLIQNLVIAQDIDSTAADKPEWFRFNGYLKYMQTDAFSGDSLRTVDNLIHNRLNFAGYFGKNHKLVAQFRNRILFGYSVRTNPNYGKVINDYDGAIQMEWLPVNNETAIISVIADRLYYEYSSEKWQFTAGRQRINWGINTTWNPNDVFNSYNIYDFDYEERQGSDAIRVQFFPNYLSSMDLAYKFTGDLKTDVLAAKYKFNKKNYDYQVIAGKFKEKIAIGGGWAGSIKLVGFKGELTAFIPYTVNGETNLSASTTFDYSWSGGLYLMGTYLYNSTGSNHPIDPFISVVQVPNAEFLMPARHNALISSSYPFSPIFSGNLGVIYGFEINSLTVFPTLTLNVKTNLDLDVIGQFFFQELPQSEFSNLANGIFWRLKWSF